MVTRKIQLHREGAIALLGEARRELENGTHELFHNNDESQRATIAACAEIIGRLGQEVDPRRWPTEDTPVGKLERWFAEFEFSEEALAWIEWDRGQMEGFVADFDSGVAGVADPGYHAEQVFLLHVLDGILRQRDEVKV